MSQLLHYKLKGIQYFDVLEAINELTIEDLEAAKLQLQQQYTSVVEIKNGSNLPK
jgi:predicted Zn-dependent peptidase